MIACAICGILAYQDIASRHVSAGLLGLLGMLGLAFSIQKNEQWLRVCIEIGINSLFILFLLGGVVIYFRLKGEKSFFDTMMGWGDVWMLFALTPWFSFKPYLLMYLFSTLMALVVSLVFKYKAAISRTYTVPYIAYLAFGFIIYICATHFFKDYIP